jgi:hypothetical protein
MVGRPDVAASPAGRCGGVVLAATLVPAKGRVAGAEAHPNVVVILTDDQRWTTLPIMQTVERTLVARGVRFAR